MACCVKSLRNTQVKVEHPYSPITYLESSSTFSGQLVRIRGYSFLILFKFLHCLEPLHCAPQSQQRCQKSTRCLLWRAQTRTRRDGCQRKCFKDLDGSRRSYTSSETRRGVLRDSWRLPHLCFEHLPDETWFKVLCGWHLWMKHINVAVSFSPRSNSCWQVCTALINYVDILVHHKA